MTYINAISYYFPERFIDNETIVKEFMDYSGESESPITAQLLFEQCGVKKRYVSHVDESCKMLGNKAAENLFAEWKIDRTSIEYIIFVSDALEYKGPTTACVMQHDLQLNQTVAAIDVLHGCTGWIYGLSLARAVIEMGLVQNVLVVTADTPTKVIHPGDPDIRAIFSDAGAATLVSNAEIENGINLSIGNFTFGTDGKGERSLFVDRSGTNDPADAAWLSQHKNLPPKQLLGGRLYMDSPKIFLFAFRRVPKLIQEILNKNQLDINEIDFFIFHQANGTMLEFLRKRLKIPKEKFIISIEHVGNTVSASIPIAMKGLIDGKNIKTGQKILVAGFGIGFSWGATILTK